MRKCKNCEKEFDGIFCPYCGTKAEETSVCPACGARLDSDAKFCLQCGKPVEAQGSGVVIRNVTKFDMDFNLRAVENMSGKKCRLMLFIAAAALGLLGGVFLALELLLWTKTDPDLEFPIICLVFAFVLVLFALLLKPFFKLCLKKSTQGKQSTQIFAFTQEGYENETRLSDGTQSKATGSYEGFIEAKEYRDMWLLYISKATVFAVSKDGMTQGTAEELSEMLARNMGTRYKVCYKK